MAAAVVAEWGEPDEAPEATTGTEVHLQAALVLTAMTRANFREDAEPLERVLPPEDVWPAFTDEWQRTSLSEWDIACVKRYVGFCYDLICRHNITPENVLVEHKLDMESVGIKRKGTADCLLVVPFERVIVADLKAGFLEQDDASEHEQAHAYAMAAAVTFRCERAEAYIYNARQPQDARATGAVLDAETIRANAAWTRSVCDMARAEDPELKPGIHCANCDALVACPACEEWRMRVMQAIKEIGRPATPEGWGELTAAAKVGEKQAKAAYSAAKEHAQAGGEIAGFSLQATGSVTKIDATKAAELAGEDIGRCRALLAYATIKAAAAKDCAWLADAIAQVPKSPALVQAKREQA